jgi:hypothetical protein
MKRKGGQAMQFKPVDAIRAAYPHVRRISDEYLGDTLQGNYCVLGAFVAAHTPNGVPGFPSVDDVIQFLYIHEDETHPFIDDALDDLEEYFHRIISANDRGNFGVAWSHLQALITYLNTRAGETQYDHQ